MPSSARIQPASPKIHRFTNGNSNKHRDKLLRTRIAPARPQHIPCYNTNHTFASYIAFPIGHRLLIRLFVGRKPPVIAHISIDMSSPLAQLAKKKQYQANSSILLIGLQKVHQITKNNTQHGGFTRIYSPKFS